MSNQSDLKIITAETMGKDLLGALVTEIRLLKKPWEKLSENQQNELIERLRNRIGDSIAQAVHILAADGRVVCQGDLDQVTIKDGVKAVVKFSLSQPNLHEMYEAQGKSVLLVVADEKKFTTGMDEVQGESDQRTMDMGHEYHDNDGGGMDDSDVVDAEYTAPALPSPTPEYDGENADEDPAYDRAVEYVVREQRASISFIQRMLGIGYNRAARLIERMEREGIVSPADPQGARIVFKKPD
jgi:hypothetical protein